MTRSQSGDLLPLVQELERTCRNFKRVLKARLAAEEVLAQLQIAVEEEMGDPQNNDVVIPEEQTMGYYWTARAADMRSPIQHPQVPANKFEVSTFVITMLHGSVVFRGKEGECPQSHMRRFHELIDGIKINGVPADAIQLRYFPFTLKEQAKEWLDTRHLDRSPCSPTWRTSSSLPSPKRRTCRSKLPTLLRMKMRPSRMLVNDTPVFSSCVPTMVLLTPSRWAPSTMPFSRRTSS
ncbi:unnamed protein product [Linum trigynum]|uniref:Uncharacterized protein n=1 Tax=Linum trigynum TaxID=586398 RepID=A0AAV2CCX0_9ROSI